MALCQLLYIQIKNNTNNLINKLKYQAVELIYLCYRLEYITLFIVTQIIIKSEIHLNRQKIHIDICSKAVKSKKKTENTINLQNMSVSGSGNNTFLKIHWAGNHQKGAISGP